MARFGAQLSGNFGIKNLQTVKGLGGRMSAERARQIVTRYRSFTKAVQAATPEITLEALQPVFDLSQVYVPKDTLELQKSGYLRIKRRGRTPTVEIGYGIKGKPFYAVIVHEMQQYHHQPPTRAKYLAAALREKRGEVMRRIHARLKV